MSRWKFLAAAMVAALVVGVAVSSARGKDTEIQKGNTSCGVPNGDKSLGVAVFNFNQKDNSLTVVANIKHGLPKTQYTVSLLDADTCTEIVTFSKSIGTNTKGKGRRSYTADVGSSTSFVIDAFDGSSDNYSEAVHF
jgi:hypothetical protein